MGGIFSSKKDQQTFLLNLPSTLPANGTATATVSGGSGTGPVNFSSTTPVVCTISPGGSISTLQGGDCSIKAEKAASGKYKSATATKTITISKLGQAPVTLNLPTSVLAQIVQQLNASGGSGTGSFSWESITPAICDVSSSGSLTAKAPGSCSVKATKSGDSIHNPQSATGNISISKLMQSPLSLTVPNSMIARTTGQASVTGGSGTGSTSFSSTTPTVCSTTMQGVISGLVGGSCGIKAAKAGDDLYDAAEASRIFDILKASGSPLTLSVPQTISVGGTGQASVTGGSGSGTVTYTSKNRGICTASGTGQITGVSGSSVWPDDFNNYCTITATKAADASYNSVSDTKNVTVTKVNQAPISLMMPASLSVGGTGKASVTGGSGTGGVSYSTTTPAVCGVSSTVQGLLNGIVAGSCSVTATKAGDASYNAVSDTKSITLGKANQAPISLMMPASLAIGGTGQASVTGGSGTGGVSYTSKNGGICTVSSSGQITGVSGSSVLPDDFNNYCTITATKAGDANYNAVSDTKNVTVTKANQAPLALTMPASLSVGGTGQASVSGGSGTGGVSYSTTTPGVCGVSSTVQGLLNGIVAGTCSVTATKAADASYNAVSDTKSITVAGKANQAPLSLMMPASLAIGGTGQASVTGGSGTGGVSYLTTTPAVCGVSSTVQGLLNGIVAGSCSVTATKTGDASYNAISDTKSIVIPKVNQSPISLMMPASLAIGGTGQASVTGGSGTGGLSYSTTTPTVCGVSSLVQGLLNGIVAGTCSVTATKAGDASYNAISDTKSITLGKAGDATYNAISSTPQSIEIRKLRSDLLIRKEPEWAIYIGARTRLDALPVGYYDRNEITNKITYHTSTPETCKLSSVYPGLVTGIAPGECFVYAKTEEDAMYLSSTSDIYKTTVRGGYGRGIPLEQGKYFFITPGFGTGERKTMVLTDSGDSKSNQLKYESVWSPFVSIYTKLKSLTNAQLQLPENNYLKKYLFYALSARDGGYSIFGFNNKCWRYNTNEYWACRGWYDKPQWYINLADPYEIGCESPRFTNQWGSFVYTNDNKLASIDTTGDETWFIHPEGSVDVPNIQPGTGIIIYQGNDQDPGNRIKVTINYTQAEYF
jgi:hypothetical protein